MSNMILFGYRDDPRVAKKLNEARSFLQRTLSKTKYASKNVRGLEFDIDIRDLMDLYIDQNGKCALTGWELEFTRGGSFENGTTPYVATIDRIFNGVGYKKWNIQLTCWKANKIKNSLSNREFKDLCRSVANRHED